MAPYKRIPLIVEAFQSLPSLKLVVIGDGDEMPRVKAKAGPNVEVLGHQSKVVLRDMMQRARAFVFAAEEDFGIAPVEAQACGTPVIAHWRGGVLDSIVGNGVDKTGAFFDAPTSGAIAEAVLRFDINRDAYSPASCHANAQRFGSDRFRSRFAEYVSREC